MKNFKNKLYDSLNQEILKKNSFVFTAESTRKLIEVVKRFKLGTNNKSDRKKY